MATSHEALCRLKLQSIIGATLPDRVGLGLDDKPANTSFFSNLSPEGPYCIIMPAQVGAFDFQARHYEISIPVRIYFAIAADQDSTFVAIEDLVFGEILQACVARANYDGEDGVSPPDRDVGQSLKVQADLKPIAAFYELTFVFPGSMNS